MCVHYLSCQVARVATSKWRVAGHVLNKVTTQTPGRVFLQHRSSQTLKIPLVAKMGDSLGTMSSTHCLSCIVGDHAKRNFAPEYMHSLDFICTFYLQIHIAPLSVR